MVSPSPELHARMQAAARGDVVAAALPTPIGPPPTYFGFNDGVIRPPEDFPSGVSARSISRAASRRALVQGAQPRPIRVIVALAEFSDEPMERPKKDFEEIFFSSGVVPTGSVTEYFREVSSNAIHLEGVVAGPYLLPRTLEWYANANFGIGNPSGEPRANILAHDLAALVDRDLDLQPYDNDGNGYVDAFVIVHAGPGGEATGNPGDLWSHKWVTPRPYSGDGVRIYAYNMAAEDSPMGVHGHELGHLLLGLPDLYAYTHEGVGRWCMMGAGSWNNGGHTPAHLSAWCKAELGWADVETITTDSGLVIPAVRGSRVVKRLETGRRNHYFLVENRQLEGYDSQLPGPGLVVSAVNDNARGGNTGDERNPQVRILQADGLDDLATGANRGDAGDAYPGPTDNRALTDDTNPSTRTRDGRPTGVALTDISDSGPVMRARAVVHKAPATTAPPVPPLHRLAAADRRRSDARRPGGNPGSGSSSAP